MKLIFNAEIKQMKNIFSTNPSLPIYRVHYTYQRDAAYCSIGKKCKYTFKAAGGAPSDS